MKACRNCHLFYREQTVTCPHCQGEIEEVDLKTALKLTRQASLKNTIRGKPKAELPDAYQQYHIRSYLKDRSLFLDFDLLKNRLKHGRRLKRFFIAPVNITSVLNLPWFLFNVISTNLFHMNYTRFCSRCQSKINPQQHDLAECNYNIEYFNILDDILSGRIVDTKIVYQHYAAEKRTEGIQSAYDDLFRRKVRWEIFCDVLSVGFSVFLWIYFAVYVSYPMCKVLAQKIQQFDSYEVGLELR